MSTVCPACGADNAEDARRCAACGEPLPSPAEPELLGAERIDYRQGGYALGLSAEAYGIWDDRAGGNPVRTFPLTGDGWNEAWATYQGLSSGEAGGRLEIRPGEAIDLRPMRVGQILDAAVTLYRNHAGSLLGIVAVVVVPYVLLQYLVLQALIEPIASPDSFFQQAIVLSEQDLLEWTVANGVFGALYYFFVTPLLTGAVVAAAATAYLGGRVTAGAAFRATFARLGSLLLVIVLTTLAVIGGFILLIIPAIIFYVRLIFAPSVVMLEEFRGRKAMARSWELSRGLAWKIFGTTLLAGLLASIVAGIITIPFSLGGTELGGFAGSGWLLMAAGAILGQVLITPFTTMVVVLLYFDARIRKEGLDVQLMTAEVGTAQPPDAH